MKGYLVLDLTIIHADEFFSYADKIPEQIKKHKGKYLVKGAVPEKIEGDWLPDHLVVIEFEAEHNAKQFLDDPDSQNLFKIRKSATNSNLLYAQGCEV